MARSVKAVETPCAQTLVVHPGPVRARKYTFNAGAAGSGKRVPRTVLPALMVRAEPSRLSRSARYAAAELLCCRNAHRWRPRQLRSQPLRRFYFIKSMGHRFRYAVRERCSALSLAESRD